MRNIFLVGVFLSPFLLQAQIDSINILQPAAVSAVTSDERAPFTHTNFNAEELN